MQKDCHFDLDVDHQRENLAGKAGPDCAVKVTKRTVMRGRLPHGEGSVRIGWRGLGRVLQCSSCQTSEQEMEWRQKAALGERMK